MFGLYIKQCVLYYCFIGVLQVLHWIRLDDLIKNKIANSHKVYQREIEHVYFLVPEVK